MSRPLEKAHQDAHQALQDWACYMIMIYRDGDGWTTMDFLSTRMPPHALIPRIAFWPNTEAKIVDYWWHDTTDKMRKNAYIQYLADKEEKPQRLSKDQLYRLHQNVSKYLKTAIISPMLR